MINMLKVLLPVEEGGGPYDIMLHEDGDTCLAWFVVQGLMEKGEKPLWLPTPMPKPLLQDKAMLQEVADGLFADGYCLTQAKLTVH